MIGITSFVALHQLHIGPIRALMGSILNMAALATSMAPRICQAFLTQGVLTLRATFFSNAVQGRRQLRHLEGGYDLQGACEVIENLAGKRAGDSHIRAEERL